MTEIINTRLDKDQLNVLALETLEIIDSCYFYLTSSDKAEPITKIVSETTKAGLDKDQLKIIFQKALKETHSMLSQYHTDATQKVIASEMAKAGFPESEIDQLFKAAGVAR
ncbi:MAG: hypothetical protein QME05_03085 [Candidatus Margulisbacteria bacterium]|nr:hypothetical protein [Candidatus Margulisiibacteriota bacterium]